MGKRAGVNRSAWLAFAIALSLFIGSLSVCAEGIIPARPVLPSGGAQEAIEPARPDVWAAEEAEGEDEEEDEDDEALPPEEEADPNVEPEEELSFEDKLLASIDESADALEAVNGMTNILLVGLDARPGQKTGRSDTMILLTMDAEHNNVKLMSFMRDLYVEIPGHKNNRINAAYVYGGPSLLMETIEKNFGVQVDHYVAVNFSALASVIDQIGGLKIDVNPKYVKRINAVIKEDNKVLRVKTSDGLLKEGGEQTLTGKQAQAYARYRYGTSDGDFGRTVRQREVIVKAINKIRDLSMASLMKLALGNIDKISTDMEVSEMLRLAPALFKLSAEEVKELRIPVDKGYSSKTIAGMSVLVPDRGANIKAITSFLKD
jgi:LCP family protein required for cell wall assembly